MSENNLNRNVSNDEIDLLDLFNRIGRKFSQWASAAVRAVLRATVFLLKSWLPLSLSIIAGLGISLLLKTTSPSIYTSDLVLKNNTISNADMISYINRLHTYCKEKNYTELSRIFSVAPQNGADITDISAYWIIDKGKDGIPDFVDYKNKHNIYDTLDLRMFDRLDIRAKIKSSQDFPVIRKGILSFINSDSLYQQRNRVRIKQNGEMLSRLDYDIIQLDSLQKVKYFEETRNRMPKNGGQMIFLQEQKTQLLYSDIYALYSRKQALEADRDLYEDIVTVLSEFSVPVKQTNGVLFYSKIIIPVIFTITLIILIFLANRKKFNEIYNKY